MILVDTSVWISFFKSKNKKLFTDDIIKNCSTCPVVVQEIFQGLKLNKESDNFKNFFLALPILANPIGLDLYLKAADIFGLARRKGFTVRSSIDCLIAAIAIEHKVPIWHQDRDFSKIAKVTNLRIFSR